MIRLATGGRLGVAIGVAGGGKSAALVPLVDAWKAEGRKVFGISLAWRQAGDLKAAGIQERASVAAFLKRVETGKYALDRNSVVVVDEVSLLGTRQMLELLRLQDRTGMQLVKIGDPMQCNSIEGGPGLELLRQALGSEAIPEILTSIRQKTERECEIAGLFRAGRAAEALEMKQADGTAELVAGGREATVARVSALWRERIDANSGNPDFQLTISAPTNADTCEIGAAIRAERREMGQIGADLTHLAAINPQGERYDLPLAIGDHVRLFDRVRDTTDRTNVLASNGEVVEIRKITGTGMRVRNAAGLEGEITWRALQKTADGPVRLTYGYATTVDRGYRARVHRDRAYPRPFRRFPGDARFEICICAPRRRNCCSEWKPTGTTLNNRSPPAVTRSRTGSSSTRRRSASNSRAGPCSGSDMTSVSPTCGVISAKTSAGNR